MSSVFRLPSTKLLRNWILALGCAGLIWFVSSQPLHGPIFEGTAKKGLDKVAHAVEYGLLATLLFEAFRRSIPRQARGTILGHGRVRRALVLAAFVASLFAVADEIHQMAIPYRSCDVTDVWADMTGVVLALALRMRRLSKKHA